MVVQFTGDIRLDFTLITEVRGNGATRLALTLRLEWGFPPNDYG